MSTEEDLLAERLTVAEYQVGANSTAAPVTQEVICRFMENGEAWVEVLEKIIELGTFADKVKKHTFYGKGSSQRFPEEIIALDDPQIVQKIDILHGLIGLITEAGEIAEAIYDGDEVKLTWDMVNLMEEGGDSNWYIAQLAKGTKIPLATALYRNLEKLRKKRFASGKFTEQEANNRNLEEERKALEGQ